MAMWIGPVLGVLAEFLRSKGPDVAKQTGVAESTVGQVGEALTRFLTQDERLAAQLAAEMEQARNHDVQGLTLAPPLVQLLRGLVRPVITLTAFGWYVYARSVGIVLAAEDYAIVGGIMAFWFGFRPFEKTSAGPLVGGKATGGR
jgi:hypothetical protein